MAGQVGPPFPTAATRGQGGDRGRYACPVLTSNRAAKRQIQRWTHEYVINVAAAYRLFEEFFLARRED